MPSPIAICLEDLDLPHDAHGRYLRCAALPGGSSPGLGLDGTGRVLWRSGGPIAAELWVSGDQRLALLRPEGAEPSWVRREGRSLEVPPERPVVLLSGDVVEIGGRRLRVHVHGPTEEVEPPAPLPGEEPSRPPTGLARTAAYALAVGAAATSAAAATLDPFDTSTKPIEVRTRPPKMAPPRRDAGVPPVPPKKKTKEPSKDPAK